jgi:hypothetical protein
VAEAKKNMLPPEELNKSLRESADKCALLSKEFAELLGKFSKDLSVENLTVAQNKFDEVNSVFAKIRSGIRK